MAEEENSVPMELGLENLDQEPRDPQLPPNAAEGVSVPSTGTSGTESPGADGLAPVDACSASNGQAHLDLGTSTESAENVSIDLEKPSVRAQLSQQAQTVLEADSKGITLQQQPLDSSGAAVSAPLPAESVPLNGEGVLPQLGQFSSIIEKSTIRNSNILKKENQSFCKYNFANEKTISVFSSEITRDHTSLQNCNPIFSKDLSGSQQVGHLAPKMTENGSQEKLKQNITLSEGFLTANKNDNASPAYSAFPTAKTFAQIAAPPNVAATIPSRGSTPECGFLVERLKGSLLDDYAKAVESVTGKRTLVFMGQSPEDPNYVLAFLERPALVDKVVSQGIYVKGKWLCVTHISQPATKLVISDVMPFIPDKVVINAFKQYGIPVYEDLRRIPGSLRSQEFKHLLSYRRELLIVLDKNKSLPDHIAVFTNNKVYKLGVSVPGLICFNCKVFGHKAATCKKPRTVNSEGGRKEEFGQPQVAHAETQSDGDHSAWTGHSISPPEKVQGHGKKNLMPKQPGCSNDKTDLKLPTQGTFKFNLASSSWKPTFQVKPPSQTACESAPSVRSDAWQMAGKKGKTIPLVSSAAIEAQKKALKLEKNSDVTSLRTHEVAIRDGSQSPKRAIADPGERSAEPPTAASQIAKNRNKKKGPRPPEKMNLIIGNSSKPQPSNVLDSTQDEKSLGISCIEQLKKLQASLADSKPKHLKKELDLAQPIVEDLLQSVWSLRTSKRRAVLMNFQERHTHLVKYVEAIMSIIPNDMQGSQVYKSLANIKQDLRVMSSADSRKSRISKT